MKVKQGSYLPGELYSYNYESPGKRLEYSWNLDHPGYIAGIL